MESGSPEMFRVRYRATRDKRKDMEILEEITEIWRYWKRYGDSSYWKRYGVRCMRDKTWARQGVRVRQRRRDKTWSRRYSSG